MMHKSRSRSTAPANLINRGSKRVAQFVDTALIEPNMLFREGLAHILAATQFQVVVKVDAVETLASALRAQISPTLFILRTSSEVQNTIDDVIKLKKRYPSSHIACIGQSYGAEDIAALLRVGADALMLRSMSAAIFVKSLELVILGERIIPQEVMDIASGPGADIPLSPGAPHTPAEPASIPYQAPAAPEPPCFGNLSAREHDILYLLINGDSNKNIAIALLISEATVKVHIKAILRKIQVKNRTQAAIWALHHLASEDPKPRTQAANGSGGPIVAGAGLGDLERK